MEFPYTAWRLMPSCKPAEVKIVRHGRTYENYLYDEKGKCFHISELHATRDEAINAGREMLEDQAKKVRSLQELIEKRRAVLDKAAQQAGE